MYRVLLVDDEQLALSGVKYMLDWASLDCEIVGTADNGRSAVENIRALAPDIVICDIELPIYSGVQLLEIFSESAPDIVFIMLTNYQDFELLQSALHFNASDYLLKNGLKASRLIAAIEKAKRIHQQRQQMKRVHYVQNYLLDHTQEALNVNIPLLLRHPGGSRSAEGLAICESLHAFEQFCLIHLRVHLAQIPSYDSFTERDVEHVLGSIEDVIRKIQSSLIPRAVIWEGEEHGFYLLGYQIKGDFEERMRKFQERLLHIVSTVTGAGLSVLCTGLHSGSAQLNEAQAELAALETRFFHQPEALLLYGSLQEPPAVAKASEWPALDELARALLQRDLSLLADWFRAAEACCAMPALDRDTAVGHCVQAFRCVRTVAVNSPVLKDAFDNDQQQDVFLLQAVHADTSDRLIGWLNELRASLVRAFEESDGMRKRDYLEIAKRYIQAHIDERLTLNDVSTAVHISPNYLSSLFMRQMSVGFIDYVNQLKTKKACELLGQGKYLVYQIADRLGYENAYYFSRVFRKYVGCSPKEYQARCEQETPVKKPID